MHIQSLELRRFEPSFAPAEIGILSGEQVDQFSRRANAAGKLRRWFGARYLLPHRRLGVELPPYHGWADYTVRDMELGGVTFGSPVTYADYVPGTQLMSKLRSKGKYEYPIEITSPDLEHIPRGFIHMMRFAVAAMNAHIGYTAPRMIWDAAGPGSCDLAELQQRDIDERPRQSSVEFDAGGYQHISVIRHRNCSEIAEDAPHRIRFETQGNGPIDALNGVYGSASLLGGMASEVHAALAETLGVNEEALETIMRASQEPYDRQARLFLKTARSFAPEIEASQARAKAERQVHFKDLLLSVTGAKSSAG